MESHARSIAKTISWRILATIITTSVAYALKGEIAFALEIGALDTSIKLGVYFFHERMWNKINFGRLPTEADFEI
jgi:uncharacterized membrane protein